jgi:hypothetical protein
VGIDVPTIGGETSLRWRVLRCINIVRPQRTASFYRLAIMDAVKTGSQTMNRVNCPGCGHRLKYADEHAGKKARCQKCRQSFPLPSTARASELNFPKSSSAQEAIESGEMEVWTELAEQAGGLPDEEKALKSVRSRILEVATERLRAEWKQPGKRNGDWATALVLWLTHIQNEVDRRLDSEPPERRLSVARRILAVDEEQLAHAKERWARTVLKGTWNLTLLAIMWLFAIALVAGAVAGMVGWLTGK